jgi:hypothetical protein
MVLRGSKTRALKCLRGRNGLRMAFDISCTHVILINVVEFCFVMVIFVQFLAVEI